MSWINIFFFVIILNTITGTVAYLLCKLLTRIAEKAGAVRIVYPLYRLVLFFYVVPLGWFYVLTRYYQIYGVIGIGDTFYGNSLMFVVMQIALVLWIIGLILSVSRTAKKEWKKRQFHNWKMQHNMPLRADKYKDMLKRMYPHRNWNRIQFYTNFTMKSPVVAGAFAQKIILPDYKLTDNQIKVILMHEGMHIVRFDNLAKRISNIITYINWFNPLFIPYIKELDEWGDIACDINVCQRFLGGDYNFYYNILLDVKASERSVVPPFVSQLNSIESMRRRMKYMKKWKTNGSKKIVSALLMATLVLGSTVTAFASSAQVTDTQNDVYIDIRETEKDIDSTDYYDELTEYEIPAEQVDESKWDNAIIYNEPVLAPMTVQKSFDWTVPAQNFAHTIGFIKNKGTNIIVSCYIYSDLTNRVGIRRPDGSMLYVLGTHQVTHTFPCETFGTYYVFVENTTRVDFRAAGYYIR